MNTFLLKGIVAAVLAGMTVAGYFAWRTQQRSIGAAAQYAIDKADMAELKVAAAMALTAAEKQRDLAEQQLGKLKHAQEVKDATNTRTVSGLKDRLYSLAAAGSGRLRDPNATLGCGGGGDGPTTPPTATAGAGDSSRTEAAGVFSEPATRLLQQLTSEADEINLAYISCRADVFSLRSQ